MDTTKSVNLINFSFNYSKPSLLIESNWIFISILFTILILALIIYFIKKRSGVFTVTGADVELSSTPSIKFIIKRNIENLVIANRIFLELITRKAALPFEEEYDTIIEVYDSLYKLFGIIRDEIKNVPGEFLRKHDPTKELIGLTLKILNDGLRPHLTKHQAKFRKWYKNEIDKPENKNKTPQDIQKNYKDYKELVASMKTLNDILMKYSKKLEEFISGK